MVSFAIIGIEVLGRSLGGVNSKEVKKKKKTARSTADEKQCLTPVT